MATEDFKPDWTVLKWVLITLTAVVLIPLLAFASLFAALSDYARAYYFLALCFIVLLGVSIRRYRLEKRTRLRDMKSRAEALQNLEREELDAARAWKKPDSGAASPTNISDDLQRSMPPSIPSSP
ncbi:hypothetical protein [Phyllobacterium myrsinacearum]|uniref:Type VI protein secretion system component VasK n=1 Tax=Phyllobacterium myrsinacearum TaxID=28101 RepID=A0A839ESY8_9HYPH|nr:hypothetical protein [Phyllobacterium myrsinacearum]MBA8882039.1 type VI protein secretion system component VasK [Phyllobacterium myrsinacearum]